jgi:ABC-type glycerol-3-phosphate transport system substrate-binding protein
MKIGRARFAIVSGLAVLVVTVCVGVAGARDQQATRISGPLEVVSYQAPGSPMWSRYQRLAKQFEKLYPGTHIKLTFGGGSGEPPIAARYRAGDPPDVDPSVAGPDGPFAAAGQLLDLGPALKTKMPSYKSSWRNAIYKSVLPFLQNSKTHRYVVAPESVTTIQFFYNKAIFAKYGITPPKTLDQLFAAAAKLKANGVAPFAVTGTFDFYMELYYDYLLLRYSGATPVEHALAGTTVPSSQRVEFNAIPGATQAAAKLGQMVSNGWFMPGFQSTDFTSAQLAFFQGKTAMILMGSWLQSEMAGKIPAGFKLGTFSFPTVPGAHGDQTGTFGGVQFYEIAAKSKHRAAAIAWLKFIANKANQTSYVRQLGAISAYKGVPAPAGFQDTVDKLATGVIVPSYFNLFGLPTNVQAAYQGPIAKLFFGQEDPNSVVPDISKGLDAAYGG